MRKMAIKWMVIIFSATGIQLHSLQVAATPSGGVSEKQTLIAIDEESYSVLSIERRGGNTHFHLTNRIALKRYSLGSNELLHSSVLMESQYNSGFATVPPKPATVSSTDTELRRLESILGERVGCFSGYVRKPKHKIASGSDGIFMDKYGERTMLMTVKQLESRIPDYLQLLEYNAFEVVGIQGSARSKYFIVVRSNEWGSDSGSFEQVISIPEP